MDEEGLSEADTTRLASERQRSVTPLPRYDWQLLRVRLHDVKVERLEQDKPPIPSEKRIGVRAEIEAGVAGKRLVGKLTVNIASPTEEAPKCQMQFTFEGSFGPRDPSVVVPGKAEIDARFAATVLVLLWPYAREFAHDLMRRMEVEARPLPTIDSLSILEEAPHLDS